MYSKQCRSNVATLCCAKNRRCTSSSCNIAFIFAFESLVKDVLDEHTPVIEKRVKKHVQPPWMSNDIEEGIEERDKHLKRARWWNFWDDWRSYRRAKNSTSSRELSLIFFANKSNKGNPKGILRLLKQLGGTSKPLPKISNLNYNGSSVLRAGGNCRIFKQLLCPIYHKFK